MSPRQEESINVIPVKMIKQAGHLHNPRIIAISLQRCTHFIFYVNFSSCINRLKRNILNANLFIILRTTPR